MVHIVMSKIAVSNMLEARLMHQLLEYTKGDRHRKRGLAPIRFVNRCLSPFYGASSFFLLFA